MALGMKQRVGCLVKDSEIDLDVCIAWVYLDIIFWGSYDIVIRMDWSENHEVILDCKNKKLYFVDDVGHKRNLVGKNIRVSLRFISALKLKRNMRKGCKLYDVISMNVKKDSVNLEQYLVLSSFLDVFPEELPELLPKRELEFMIELKPATKSITRARYCMTTSNL
jgi:hypothetical protein